MENLTCLSLREVICPWKTEMVFNINSLELGEASSGDCPLTSYIISVLRLPEQSTMNREASTIGMEYLRVLEAAGPESRLAPGGL